MKSAIAIAAVVASAVLAGCAAPGSPGSGSGASYIPIIDSAGADQTRYASDLAACQQLARNVDAQGDGMRGLASGIVAGLLASAIVGGNARTTDQAMSYGAAVGGSQATSRAISKQQMVVINCMAGRGYRTLDGGNVSVVQIAQQQGAQVQPTAQAQSQSVTPAAQQAAAPAQDTVGRESHQVERMAEAKACNSSPRAVLTNKGPGVEMYTVACSGGDFLTVRCEWGNCRALR